MARVLVVDDDSGTVDALAALLAGDGHEVAPFTSSVQALAALRGGTFDIVITDLEMPGADGEAVTRAARASSPTACIVVTNRGVASRARLEDAGACFVLEKPIDYEVMHRMTMACRGVGGRDGPLCTRSCPPVRPEVVAPPVSTPRTPQSTM